MTVKGNGTLKTVSIVASIVVGFVVVWLALSDRLDKRINDNPKIIRMETEMKNVGTSLERIENTLNVVSTDLKEHKDKTERNRR